MDPTYEESVKALLGKDLQRDYVAIGQARSVLILLDARGLDAPYSLCERIAACKDLNQLATWIRCALTADSTEDLFVCSAANQAASESDTPQGREHTAKCRARGLATAILAVSESRGIDVPPSLRQHLIECTDPDQQHTWLIRAVSVEHAEQLFA